MRRIMVLFLLCAVLMTGIAHAEGNLVVNGNFETSDDGKPAGWVNDMWLWDVGVTYIELREGEGRSGSRAVMIENISKNDARLVQDVPTDPNTVYRLAGWIRAEGIPTSAGGAGFSVIGSFESLPVVYDTGGEWIYLESYLRTDTNQTSLKIGPRLGDYSADNTGRAYFDDMVFERVTEVLADADIIQLTNHTANQQTQTAADDAPASQTLILPLLVGFAVLIILLYCLRMRSAMPRRAWLFIILAAAVLLRLYLMATQTGYQSDMECFYAWSSGMARLGPNAFYEQIGFCDYPPGYMYIMWLTGWLMQLLGITGLNEAGRLVVKFIPMLFDVACILAIWRLAHKRLGELPALLLCALYAFSPAVLVDGAMWGQVDMVVSFGLLVTVGFALRGNWKWALPAFTVTVLMKPQALMAGPVGLTALVLDIIPWKTVATPSGISLLRDVSKSAPQKDGRKKAIDAAIGLGISAVIAVVMLLPFVWGKAGPIGWVIERYTESLSSYNYATLNTMNLYYLLGANWTPLSDMLGPFRYGTWGTALMIVVVAGLILLYIRHRDRNLLPFFVAMTYIGLYMFGVKMHERYLFPAFALLLYAYIRRPDWRVLAMFCGFSCVFFINCSLVLRDLHLATGFHPGNSLLSLVNLGMTGLGIWVAVSPTARPLPQPKEALPSHHLQSLDTPSAPMFRMEKRDWALMLGLTVLSAALGFVGLGTTTAPQTVWHSTGATESIEFDLGETKTFEILYYGGINHRNHTFSFESSDDGEAWTDSIPQRLTPGSCFQWKYASSPYYDTLGEPTDWPKEPTIFTGRYVRLTTNGPALSIMEITFRDLNGEVLPVLEATSYGYREESASDPWMLVDEGVTAPEYPSYYNSTYFDEIYHARTGYEHAHGLGTYEWTHPPLGKVFIMLAIKVFGMTPFGWRFAGTLAGVLMVPAMYLLGKLLFKKSRYAFLAAFVMTFDMMHLTQTRIATIDSYAVLFILLMYLCMFRYMQMSFFRDGYRPLLPLALSGLLMGLGCASKWICMYAGVGLAVLFFWTMAKRWLEWREGLRAGGAYARQVGDFPKHLFVTLLVCLVCFIAIPFAIYYFSYIPHFVSEGGLSWTRFWETQKSILNYHATLVDDHAFQSQWYEWPLMLKPMYFFDGKPYPGEGMVSTIMCMGNPAVWWFGFAAFIFMAWRWLRPHLRGEAQTDHRPALLLLSMAAQYLPWVLVPRSMYIYHYFGSLPFVMLALVYAFEQIDLKNARVGLILQSVFAGLVVVLFVGFYPLATGVPVSRAWAERMNWLGFLRLPGWKFRGWLYF